MKGFQSQAVSILNEQDLNISLKSPQLYLHIPIKGHEQNILL